ncbi:hypothetical protein TRIP_E280217 [uncultured Spirochaetota bacterium]|jgi:hypothetical protein|uniref:Uncharacterized protein n=1 Tax=uncultured Spirochaetota bacterium TaxID=460511 RepID=A0A652ZWV7_9SPIR|nr:hypothetical protein TRIP_E280217 [uncultured Spirochaetota bacterium]
MNGKMSKPQDLDLESLAQTLSDLRRSVRANNPVLKAVASSTLYPALALSLGLLMGGYCLAVSMLPSLSGEGSSWILIAALLVAGGTVKLLLTNRIAGRLPNGSFMMVLRAIYTEERQEASSPARRFASWWASCSYSVRATPGSSPP